MSENKEEQDLVNKAIDVESESKTLIMSEVKAIKKLIKGLEWRHKIQGQDLVRHISGVKNENLRYKEVMADVAAYQARFHELDGIYLRLYQVLEGDEDAGEGYLNEWDRLVTEERALKSLLEDKLGITHMKKNQVEE